MANQNPGTLLVLLNAQNIVASELTDTAVMGSDDWQEKALQASSKALKNAIAKSETANVGFETLVRAGRSVARDKGIEHIVMGTRGLGRIQGLLLGSSP
jgi:nucleotide-binding universal stress UspA family protein